MRAFLFFIAAHFIVASAGAQTVQPPPPLCAQTDERRCILDALSERIAALPEDKQARVWQVFMDTVGRAGDAALTAHYEAETATRAQTYAVDTYFYDIGAEVLLRTGQDGFVAMARNGEAPFDMGRGDIIGAVAARTDDAAFAERLYALMNELANGRGQLGDFERLVLGDAMAEAGMRRCDLSWIERGTALTGDENGLRYAFYRARVSGGTAALLPRIPLEIGTEDTRDVRQALTGYGAVLGLGVCERAASAIPRDEPPVPMDLTAVQMPDHWWPAKDASQSR